MGFIISVGKLFILSNEKLKLVWDLRSLVIRFEINFRFKGMKFIHLGKIKRKYTIRMKKIELYPAAFLGLLLIHGLVFTISNGLNGNCIE